MAHLKYVFLDLTGAFKDEIVKRIDDEHPLRGRCTAQKGTVESVDLELPAGERVAYLSPANSLCYYDGGVDLSYRNMFGNVQKLAHSRLSQIGWRSSAGRRYLPIGAALVLPVDPERNRFVVAAPTMTVPMDVSQTRNAFAAVLAALRAMRLYENSRHDGFLFDTVVCPAMCCGYGCMTYAEAAEQVLGAISAFEERQDPASWPSHAEGTHDCYLPDEAARAEFPEDQLRFSGWSRMVT